MLSRFLREQTQHKRVCLYTVWSWSQELYRYETGPSRGEDDNGQHPTEVQYSQD